MLFALSSLLLLAGAQVADMPEAETPLTGLECKAEKVTYSLPGNAIWAAHLTKPNIRPSAASDMLLMVTGPAFVRDFSFETSQGFGGTYLQVTDYDEDTEQSMPAAKQPEDAIAFHAFARNASGGWMRIADAPQSDGIVPVAIYIPDVSKHFWYNEKYEDIETGETLEDVVDMPQGLLIGTCGE